MARRGGVQSITGAAHRQFACANCHGPVAPRSTRYGGPVCPAPGRPAWTWDDAAYAGCAHGGSTRC